MPKLDIWIVCLFSLTNIKFSGNQYQNVWSIKSNWEVNQNELVNDSKEQLRAEMHN